MAEPVLIWGGGAIGGTIAAYWARAGIDVLLVDIVSEHVSACAHDGLSIRGKVDEFTQVIPALTPDQLTGTYERIVLAVKAHHTRSAMDMLLPHLARDGFVLSAQNGLNERQIAALAGQDRTMGAFVNFGADWHGPGDILFGNRGAVVVGETDGRVRRRTEDMHELLKIFEPNAVLSENIMGYLWGKLAYGAMLFATALTHQSMTENFEDKKRRPVFAGLGREVLTIAKVEGISPLGFDGFDPKAFDEAADARAAYSSLDDLAEFNRHGSKSHSGIYRDLAVRKRPTEVDAHVTLIADIAAEHGIEAPLLKRLSALVKDIEQGRREIGDGAFEPLVALCP